MSLLSRKCLELELLFVRETCVASISRLLADLFFILIFTTDYRYYILSLQQTIVITLYIYNKLMLLHSIFTTNTRYYTLSLQQTIVITLYHYNKL